MAGTVGEAFDRLQGLKVVPKAPHSETCKCFSTSPKPTRTIVLSTTVVHEPNREDIMTDKEKDSEGTDQDKSEETAMDRKLDQIANKAARKGIETEQRFDEEHGIFTK